MCNYLCLCLFFLIGKFKKSVVELADIAGIKKGQKLISRYYKFFFFILRSRDFDRHTKKEDVNFLWSNGNITHLKFRKVRNNADKELKQTNTIEEI